MTEHEIEIKLKKAVETYTPDVLESILEDCDTRKGKVINMTNKKRNVIKWVTSIAAALILVAGLGFFIRNNNENHVAKKPATTSNKVVASTILFDINPSIELKVDAQKNVISATALNDDANTILNGMTLTGTNVTTATNAIVGALLKHGYIDNLANTILVSVEDENSGRGKALRDEITAEIEAILKSAKTNASILSQYVEDNWQNVSDKYNISRGKAALIESILDVNKTYSEEDLAKLSVNELNLLLSNPANKTRDVHSAGTTASSKSYIPENKAKRIALERANIQENDLLDWEIEFDFEDGRMVYEVELQTSKGEYEYDIDAKTGNIIKTDVDIDRDNSGQSDTSDKNQNKAPISENEAKTIAFNHAGVNKSNVRIEKIELENDDGITKWEIEFSSGRSEYEYEINALNGKIIKSEIERDVDDDDDDDDDDDKKTSANTSKKISKDQALEIAFKHAGIKKSEAYVEDIELDNDDGISVWEINFSCGNTEYEYKINVKTGKIVDFERDEDD